MLRAQHAHLDKNRPFRTKVTQIGRSRNQPWTHPHPHRHRHRHTNIRGCSFICIGKGYRDSSGLIFFKHNFIILIWLNHRMTLKSNAIRIYCDSLLGQLEQAWDREARWRKPCLSRVFPRSLLNADVGCEKCLVWLWILLPHQLHALFSRSPLVARLRTPRLTWTFSMKVLPGK